MSLYHSLVSLNTQELRISFVLLTIIIEYYEILNSRFALEHRYLLRLEADTHAQFWRPSYLLFANDIGKHQLIEFCERSKKGGLFLIGHVMIGDVFKLAKPCHDLRKKWLKQIRGSSVKAIPKVIISPSTRLGYQFLMTGGGVGGLDINTIVIPLQHRAPSRSFVRGDEKSIESKTASPRNAKREHLKTHIGAIHADLNDEIEYIATVCLVCFTLRNKHHTNILEHFTGTGRTSIGT